MYGDLVFYREVEESNFWFGKIFEICRLLVIIFVFINYNIKMIL